MEQKQKFILLGLFVLCLAAVTVMIFALTRNSSTKPAVFTPPAFDISAAAGIPEISDASWTKVYQDGMSFSAHVCGNVIINNGAADLYFTNDRENKVWLKLRITDENDNILGETGLLKPDEYVKSVKIDIVPENGARVKLKIMAYEPETYYSAGAVSLNTAVGG